jgi:hypothetical protein
MNACEEVKGMVWAVTTGVLSLVLALVALAALGRLV